MKCTGRDGKSSACALARLAIANSSSEIARNAFIGCLLAAATSSLLASPLSGNAGVCCLQHGQCVAARENEGFNTRGPERVLLLGPPRKKDLRGAGGMQRLGRIGGLARIDLVGRA